MTRESEDAAPPREVRRLIRASDGRTISTPVRANVSDERLERRELQSLEREQRIAHAAARAWYDGFATI